MGNAKTVLHKSHLGSVSQYSQRCFNGTDLWENVEITYQMSLMILCHSLIMACFE